MARRYSHRPLFPNPVVSFFLFWLGYILNGSTLPPSVTFCTARYGCLSGAARYARLCVAKAAARPRATQVPTSLTSSRTRLRTEGLPCGSVSAGIARAAAQKDRPHGRPTGNLESFHGNAGNQAGAFAGFRRCLHVLRAGDAQAEHAGIQI